jgi:hypothetical protein
MFNQKKLSVQCPVIFCWLLEYLRLIRGLHSYQAQPEMAYAAHVEDIDLDSVRTFHYQPTHCLPSLNIQQPLLFLISWHNTTHTATTTDNDKSVLLVLCAANR